MQNQDEIQQSKRQKFTEGTYVNYVVLGTASIRLQFGTHITSIHRAICDTGAQANVIVTKTAKQIGVPETQCHRPIDGVGGRILLNKKTQLYILPWFDSDIRIPTELLLSPESLGTHPRAILNALRPSDQQLILADENFDIPGPVDILLGAGIWAIITGYQIYKHPTGAMMQNTMLGYVILGKTIVRSEDFTTSVNYTMFQINANEQESIDNLLKKFWELEEIPESNKKLTQADQAVERMFKKTQHRRPDGRYVVKIPFKTNPSQLGESRNIVLNRFYQLEKRMNKNNEFKIKYIESIRELQRKGYIQKAQPPNRNEKVNYIPHHAINKTKFKTVFDASCKTSNGKSINSIQFIGPKLQHDLQDQIMRFRRYKYAVSTDVVGMFMRICIDPSQWNLMRMFWRESPSMQLEEYQITVVTYGLAASIYMAVKSMMQCADDYEQKYPQAAKIIKECFYVDDGLFGSNNESTLKQICNEIEFVLQQGGFQLSKWASNSEQIEKLMKTKASQAVDFKEKEEANAEAKILGIRWLKDSDEFTIFVKPPLNKAPYTKREIISEISRLYDPNGYVAPIVASAKMIMQDLWRIEKLNWDDQAPEPIQSKWQGFMQDLPLLSKYKIPRWISTDQETEIQLHGFYDASIKGYGAVIYVRVIDKSNKIQSTILTAKSKVAPIKTVTIPRMELLSATLLSKLMKRTKEVCEFQNAKTFLWSDSTVVLYWIKKDPSELKQFVSNRVEQIQEDAKQALWLHVATEHNPADLISRGMKTQDIVESSKWKQGPSWLSKDTNEWPAPKMIVTNDVKENIMKEIKKDVSNKLHIFAMRCTNKKDANKEESIIHTLNDWHKIIRITAYALRFINNCLSTEGRIKTK